MENYVSSIEVVGLYERFDLQQTFCPGINVLYGNNGSGKTSLLHILANALNGGFGRFGHIDFGSVSIILGDGTPITIRQRKEKQELLWGFDSIDAFLIEVEIGGHSRQTIRTFRPRVYSFMNQGSKVAPPLASAYFPVLSTDQKCTKINGSKVYHFMSNAPRFGVVN